ncbi:MAG: type IX secretion system membrane protein PorP/SprF [Bacteroidales bacterium]|nr:type IX secretion system membrane protein PorP/SprF [Bacteroidales bacterium]
MKIYNRNIILLLILLSGTSYLSGQQLPLYSQYMNNGFLLNPAMAGHDGFTSFNITSRKQWVGFQNSPLTYSVSGQTRLLKKSYRIITRPVRSNKYKPSSKGRVGLGGFVFNDINGLVARTGAQFTYAYHIYMRQSQLSFGLAGQVFQYKIDMDKVSTYKEDEIKDRVIDGAVNMAAFIPDANAGIYWTSPKFFLGFSANQLLQSPLNLGSNSLDEFKMLRHYYLMSGYRFSRYQSEFELEPSFLIKTTEQLLPQADLSLKLYYKTDYWVGASFRTSGAISALFGVRSEKLYFGYAYDYSLSSIRKYSFGSHEIFVSIKFGSNARRFRWLNRY